MAYLHRVALFVLALLLPAVVYAVNCTQYQAYFNAGTGTWSANRAAAVASALDAANATVAASCSTTTVYNGQTYSTCPHYRLYAEGDATSFTVANESEYCTARFGGYPACGSVTGGGYNTRTGDYCAEPNYCAGLAGQPPNGLTCTGAGCRFYSADSTKRDACQMQENADFGCTVSGSLDVAWYDSSISMWGISIKGVTYTGTQCSPGGLTPGTGTVTGSGTGTGTVTVPPITEDHTGKCPGTVNGVEVWLTCDKTMAPGESTTTTSTVNPDGSTTTTTKTTGSTTTCTNGVCTTSSNTTTTVTVTPSGGGTGSSTTTVSGGTGTASMSGFCNDPANSRLAICDGEGGFGGTCNTGFQCTGDAVLCATAKATNEQKCLLSKESPEATLYESVKANTSTTGLGSESVAISSASFDQSNALGVSACFPDKTITIAMSTFSKTLVLPFSVLCPYLAQLGSLLVALSLLASMFIVFRR